MFVRLCLCALLVGVAGVASAQNKPAPAPGQQTAARQQLTPEQRAALQKQNQEMARYAESIAQMIDNGQTGQVWDGASDVAKRSVSRDKFVQATDAARAKLGKVDSRNVRAITHETSKGGTLPAGNYISVNFATKFSGDAKPLRELISFHEDNDHKWRLSGYHLYTGGPATAAR